MSRGVLPDPPRRGPQAAPRAGAARSSVPVMDRPRRAVIAGAAATALAGAALGWRALWSEPRHGRVRERDLVLARWPERLDGLRVALVADLHAGAPHVDEARLERVVAAVNRRAPDLVLLLGDFVDRMVHLGSRVAPESVAARLAALRAPLGTFAVLGNHDWLHDGPRVAAALRAAGIPVLENEAARAGEVFVAGRGGARTRLRGAGAGPPGAPAGAPGILVTPAPDPLPPGPPPPPPPPPGRTQPRPGPLPAGPRPRRAPRLGAHARRPSGDPGPAPRGDPVPLRRALRARAHRRGRA